MWGRFMVDFEQKPTFIISYPEFGSKDDVINNVHDTETKTSVKRLEPVIQSGRVPTRFVDVL